MCRVTLEFYFVSNVKKSRPHTVLRHRLNCYCWFCLFPGRNCRYSYFCLMHRYRLWNHCGMKSSVVLKPSARVKDLEEITYVLFFVVEFSLNDVFVLSCFFQMWLVVCCPLGARSSEIFTLLNAYIICALLWNHEQSGSTVESRTKRSDTSCKITLLWNYFLGSVLSRRESIVFKFWHLKKTSWPVFWNAILRSVSRCIWYVTQRCLVFLTTIPSNVR